MSELNEVVRSTISVQEAGISAVGFGTPAIVGPHNVFRERMRSYTGIDGLATDGFATSDPIYQMASAMFSLSVRPAVVKVGRIQVDKVKIRVHQTADAGTAVFSVLLNGVARTYTGVGGQSQDAIATAWAAVLNAVSGFDAAAVGSVITLETTVSGTAFAVYGNPTATGKFSLYIDMENDLGETGATLSDQWDAGLSAVELYDSQWYGLTTTARFWMDAGSNLNTLEIAIADWNEARIKLHAAASAGIDSTGENDIFDVAPLADTTSLATLLKTAAYERTGLIAHTYATGARKFEITVDPISDAESVVYAVKVDNATYSHTGTAGQTEQGVATALQVLLDAAAVLVATVDGAVITVEATTNGDPIAVTEDPTNEGVYSITTVTDSCVDAAALARELAVDIDIKTTTLCHKNFPGVPYDVLTSTQMINVAGSPLSSINGKDCNIYTELGGGTLRWGQTADGGYFDTRHGVDWLNQRIAEELYAILRGNEKVAYTDAGMALLGAGVEKWIQIAIGTGFIARDTATWGPKGYQITVPPVSSATAILKAARKATGVMAITWNATAAGAIHAVAVSGTLTL